MLKSIFSKYGAYCKNEWYKWVPYKFLTIPENRENGQFRVQKPLEEWGSSFHIEFEFLWTSTVNAWENVFMVDGLGLFTRKKLDFKPKFSTYLKDPLLRPNEHNDHRVPGIFTYAHGTYDFGVWLRNNKNVGQNLGIITIQCIAIIFLFFEGSKSLEIRE